MNNTERKIRIMHVAECAGGVDRYLHSLIKYSDHEKFEIILVCSQNYVLLDYEEIADYVKQIQMAHAIGKSDLRAVLEIRKLIRKYKPDIVYAHSSKAGAIVRLADIGMRNKCIYNPHGWAFNMQGSKKKQTVYKILEKVMAPFCDKIICISESERQSALLSGICSDKKLQVIYNGVDLEEYEVAKKYLISRKDLNIPENAFVIGTVGRLTKQKAPDVFIKMARMIKDIIPEAYFLMVGNGELEDKIRNYAERQGLSDCLYITGWITNPLNYIALFDVAVLLSRWEGFGLAIPEYMMCGKPIVATAVDAILNLIMDHKNGLLVPMDDYKAASEAVLEIYKDDLLKSTLIEQGTKEVYEKYDTRRVSNETEKLFYELI